MKALEAGTTWAAAFVTASVVLLTALLATGGVVTAAGHFGCW